jgi:hypothetical protein
MPKQNPWNRERQWYERWDRSRDGERYQRLTERLRAGEDDDELDFDRIYGGANRYRGDYFDLNTHREEWD